MDLRTISYLTANYAHLQGLRLVPLGLLFLASAAWRAGWLPWPPDGPGHVAGRWFAVGFLACLLAGLGLGRYYRTQFGTVRPLPSPFHAPPLLIVFLAFVLLVSIQDTQDTAAWRFPLPLVFLGAMLSVPGLAAAGLRNHYIAIAVAFMAWPSLAIVGVSLQGQQVLLDLLIGLGLIVGGVGDHLILRHLLQPPKEPYARTI